MKYNQLFICLAFLTVLILLNRVFGAEANVLYGGLSWVGWVSMLLVLVGIGLIAMFSDSARTFGFLSGDDEVLPPPPGPVRELEPAELKELGVEKYKGPVYPHPVIFPDRCIGCQACVEACPHDVLAIVDGRAAVVSAEQCMEDTACQAECPVNPKACIVINTTKKVRSRPAPDRDGSTYQTNVLGCYIIGDVSGVPLIKNAVKEGAEVIEHIAGELASAAAQSEVEFDVAIIGIGPGGASAAATAQEKGLRYVAIEQEKILSTIQTYPKGKYIFFKPDTKDWFGGLQMVGLGLTKAKYGAGDAHGDDSFENELGSELENVIAEQTALLGNELIEKIPRSLREEVSPLLAEKLKKEFKIHLQDFLRSKGPGDWKTLYQTHFLPNREQVSAGIRAELADQLQTKIPGDQREKILGVWLNALEEKGVKVNEEESCKAVNRAEDGDYFIVKTERGNAKTPQTYKVRRVVLAIGLRGAPNKLRLKNEDLKFEIDGREENKVIYSLSNPAEYRGRRIVVVGGGNVAVEAAVDLVAKRDGATIIPRSPEEMNQVTLLVRTYFAPTVKFGNKFQLYQCFDDGILDLRLGVAIKEMREHEVVLMDVATGAEIETIPNDYVFALIGGERPDRFLQSIGITIS